MTHREIIELLPWYLNATLDEDERKSVETHLAGCPDCALELQSLAKVRSAADKLGNQAPPPSPVLLNRALAQIEDYERTKPQAGRRRSAPSGSFWSRVAGFWTGAGLRSPAFAGALIAVQLLLLVILGAVALRQHNSIQSYMTLTGPSAPETRIAVAFSDGASEQEIRQAILEIHGTIVDGPSALGLYTIKIPIPPERTGEIEQVLGTLRQNTRVIRFAERKR